MLQARFRVWSSSPLKISKKTQRMEVRKVRPLSKDKARRNRVRVVAIAKTSETLNEAKICNRDKAPRTVRRNRARKKASRAKATARIINRIPATSLLKTLAKSSQKRLKAALRKNSAGVDPKKFPRVRLRRSASTNQGKRVRRE